MLERHEVFLDGTRALLEGDPIATGGEASVYAVAGQPDIVVKIYHEPPDADQQRRLASMMRMRPLAGRSTDGAQAAELAWPIALARTGTQRVIGYSMGRFALPEHVPLNALFELRSRASFFAAELDWRFLLGVAWNLAYMTARLHSEGIIIGDFSARNTVVSQKGFVTFLDCDSMAFTDPESGEVFPSSMHTPEYTAPERYSGAPASKASDDFALAVLVFQLLTGGNHPYGGVPKDSDTSISMRSRISGGTSYVLHPERITVPKGTVPPGVLPPAVQDLARRTFLPAEGDPTVRPASVRWFDALEAERSRVKNCAALPHHTYASHLDACPWCARAARSEPGLFERDRAAAAVTPDPSPTVEKVPAAAGGNGGTVALVVLVLLVLLIVLIAH
jgi:DNA-binding helix-hairpin-helix protein with protein kinase domain